MKVYTKRGDDGTTSLRGGGRVNKDVLRVETYGTLDETSSAIGMAVSQLEDRQIGDWLSAAQGDLFLVCDGLASPPGDAALAPESFPAGRADALEKIIDLADEEIAPLRNFIIPGGHPAAATLLWARTVCRRAERLAVRLSRNEPVDPAVLAYLNRLSDTLFTLARLVNHRTGIGDRPRPPK